MRNEIAEKLELGRIQDQLWGSAPGKRYGAFEIMGPCAMRLRIISSGEQHGVNEGWEHVSVSTTRRCPNWIEMSWVKDLFWNEDELVVQFHPPKSRHINIHPYVLHLWKPPHPLELPPDWMI